MALPFIPVESEVLVGAEPVQFTVEVPPGAAGGRILLLCDDTNVRVQEAVIYVMEGADLIRRVSEFEFWGLANAIVAVPEGDFITETRTYVLALVNIGNNGRIIEIIPQVFT